MEIPFSSPCLGEASLTWASDGEPKWRERNGVFGNMGFWRIACCVRTHGTLMYSVHVYLVGSREKVQVVRGKLESCVAIWETK